MLKRLDIIGNSNLGVFSVSNDDVAVVPYNVDDDKINIIKETLEVDVIKSTIAGSNLIGSLSVMNSNGMVVSPYTFDSEIEILENYGLNVAKLPDKYTAVGNIVSANDNGAIASPFLSKNSIDIIEDTLGVDTVSRSIANRDIIGSIITVTDKGFLIDANAKTSDVKFVKSIFDVEGDIGTVGHGINFVGACILANSKGAIVPINSTGPEMARVEEALGFLDNF